MQTRLFSILAAAALLFSVPAAAESPVFRIDPERSVVQFTVTKRGFDDVTGRFQRSHGEIRWHPSEPAASAIRWRVMVASVHTDATNRDRTLQDRAFFDAARHPELIFESTRVTAAGPGRLAVDGQLTMRGVTRPLAVVVRYSGPDHAPVFETDFEVDRHDFGIVGGRVMRLAIGRTVRIHLRAVTKEHTS